MVGSQTFDEQPTTAIDNNARGVQSVFAADLDGDGNLDVLGASRTDDEITWYQNDGAGTFSVPGTSVITGSADGVRDVTAADLDGDGDLDVLSASEEDNTIAWYQNNGSGSFSEPTGSEISTSVVGAFVVQAGDLDGDGDNDVVAAGGNTDGDNIVHWFRNDGTGIFTAQAPIDPTGDDVRGLRLGDLDGDGDLDVMFVSEDDDDTLWYQNDGNGHFSSQPAIATGLVAPRDLYPADLDGDRDLDLLVVTGGSNDRIRWYENDGTGTFGSSNTIATSIDAPQAVYAADMDGDGDLDVLSIGFSDDDIQIFYNNGSGSFPTDVQVDGNAGEGRDVIAADLDGDGDLDVLAAASGINDIIWYKQVTPFAVASTTPVRNALSVAPNSTIQVNFLLAPNAATITTTNARVLGDNSGPIGGTWNVAGNTATFTPNANLRQGERITVHLSSNIQSTTGTPLEKHQFQFHVASVSASGTFTANDITTDADNPSDVYAADLDGDGDLDVLSASILDDKIAWYKNDGAGTFTAQTPIATDADGARSVYAADLDGDGDLDVLSASGEDDKIAWYKNDGSGSFTAQTAIATDADNAGDVYAADLDGDGDLDVLSASFRDDKIAWYKNDGAGNFTAQTPISTDADSALSVYAADLDGDGDLDVLSASIIDDTIAWYKQGVTNDFSITQSGGSTSVTEAGSTDTFTVVLTAAPTSDVVISVTSGDTGEATVDQAILTFTPQNWDTGQTVTVTGVDDTVVDGDQTTTITLSVDDANSDDQYDPVADQTVSVATTDDEVAGLTVTESDGSTTVTEAGGTDTFTVVLNGQPESDVVMDVTSDDTGEATVSDASLTFTSANWDTPQTVTVTGVDDDLVDGDQTTTLTLSVDDATSDDAFDSVADQTISATTTDDDTAGFTVTESDGSTVVTEAGGTDSFTVVLDAEPTSDVVIDVTSADPGEATVSASSLTFTSANWDTPQTVTVTGQDDNESDGNQTVIVTLAVNDASSADEFDGVADQTVSVTNEDDELGVSIVQSGGTTAVRETDDSGTTPANENEDTFTVALIGTPTSDVVLTLSSGDTGEATVSLATLTFTPANANTAQTVSVTGTDDTVVDGDQTTTITVAVDDANSDDQYDPLPDQTVSVTTTDDEMPAFTVTESDGSTVVTEAGGTDSFTVVLDAQPTSDVAFTVTSGDAGEATVDQATLTFTNANWNTPQTVTVTGQDDTLVDGDQTTTITLAVDDANADDLWDSLPDQTVSVTTTDDEMAGFTVTESGGATAVSEEGTTDTFDVVLAGQPLTDVVLTVTSDDPGEATVSASSLTFTSATWDTPQTVTVTGQDDTLPDGTQTATISPLMMRAATTPSTLRQTRRSPYRSRTTTQASPS